MNNLIIIPARKNSVRLKNKNILKIGNKTLIEHSIIFAKKISTNTNILVSTDSKKIRDISLKNNILCPWLRPNKLSSSKASTDDVVLHALNWYEKKNSLVDFGLKVIKNLPMPCLYSRIDVVRNNDQFLLMEEGIIALT